MDEELFPLHEWGYDTSTVEGRAQSLRRIDEMCKACAMVMPVTHYMPMHAHEWLISDQATLKDVVDEMTHLRAWHTRQLANIEEYTRYQRMPIRLVEVGVVRRLMWEMDEHLHRLQAAVTSKC